MQTWLMLAIFIGAIVVVGAGVVLFGLLCNVRTAQDATMQGKYPQGHWMSIGMCIGIAMGSIPSLVGLLFDDMSSFVAIGPAIGCGLGVAIGLALENKHKDELGPLTEEEQQMRFRLTLIGLGVLASLVLSLFALGSIVLFAPR